jgi:hypothetical protein
MRWSAIRLATTSLLVLAFAGAVHAQEAASPADSRSSFDAPAAPFPAFRDASPFAATYAGDSCGRWDDQFGPLIGVDGTVRAAVTIGSDLYVVGNGITNAGGVPVSNVAKWDGTSWSSIGGTTGQLTCAATDGTNLYVVHVQYDRRRHRGEPFALGRYDVVAHVDDGRQLVNARCATPTSSAAPSRS